MNKRTFCALAAGMLAAAAAQADSNLDLATEKGCMSCHTLSGEPTHAPSFKAIARKHRRQAKAEAMLVKTVMQGNPVTGGYHWGLMPEPAPGGRQAIGEAEARQLVQWILRMQ